MISAWTKHLKDPAEQDRFQNSVLGSKVVLDRLIDILEEAKVSIEDKEISSKVYDSPNWAYRQAHVNGFKSCLAVINKLINVQSSD